MSALRRQQRVFSVFGALVLIFVGNLFSPPASAAFRYLQEGMTAPSVMGEDLLTGEEVRSDRGDHEVIIVTFWASWSKRSLDLLADLNTMATEYRDLPFRIIAINVEGEEVSAPTRERLKAQVTELSLQFPVIVDKGLEIFYAYGVVAVPSTAVLDAGGVLRYGPAGYSYTVKDHLVDSTQVYLGLKDRKEVPALVAGREPKPKASRLYQLARQLAGQRMYERAFDRLGESIEADSAFAAPYNLRGQILLDLQRPGEALGDFENAVALNESSVAAWAGWGRALMREGDLPAACGKLDQALALDEAYTPALLDRSFCKASADSSDDALALLQVALELNPRDPRVLRALGQVQESSGRQAEALAAYRAALEILYPDH